jgi:protease-4
MSELEAPPQPPPPPPRKSRAPMFFAGALSGCVLAVAALAFLFIVVAVYTNDDGEFNLSTEKVAVLPIEGEILDARETLDLLHRYAHNATVKAIVVRINSPGGAIAPSQEIYSAIRSVRRSSGKPIVASMDSVAASGGYYIAVACDRVIANPGSITGSIGVIMQWLNTKDLVQWAKLKPETITSGAMKDAGSPYRDLSESERAYFQHIVTQLHSQFVRAVAEGRRGKLSQADVARIADGRVFTGEEALQLKLIDELGTIDDAVRQAAQSAGIKGEPAKLWPKRREATLFDLLTGNASARSIVERVVSRRLPQFMYRW